MATMTFAPFLVPRSLTWDKLCALYLMVRALYPRDRFATFKAVLEVRNLLFEDEANIPAEVIDVDAQEIYNRDKRFGSATHKVATLQGMHDLPGVTKLVERLNYNNRSGYLKNAEDSLVWLIRELFNVGTANPSRQRRLDIIDLLWPVMNAYFAAAESDPQTMDDTYNPFLLTVLDEMVPRGFISAATVSKLREAFGQVERKQDTAADRVDEIEPEKFEVVPFVPGELTHYQGPQSFTGHLIVTDNTRVAGEWLQKHQSLAILVARRRSGNTAIFCRGRQDLSTLYNELERQEPGKWFLDTRPASPMLLNGSTSRHAEPTKLSATQVIDLIKKYYMHKSRKYQEA